MSHDKGLELELRALRFAWKMGYFSRRGIQLYAEDNETITDIDVIGIKFDLSFTPEYILFETKYEKGFASILKLRGLIEYLFQKGTAYIIKENINPAVTSMAQQLGIRAMPISRLEEIEKEHEIDPNESKFGYSWEANAKVKEYTNVLFKKNNGFFTYLRHRFWIISDPFYRIKHLFENIHLLDERRRKITDSSFSTALELLMSEFVCLFVVSILESIGFIYSLPAHQRKKYFMRRLIAGKLSFEEKEKMTVQLYQTIKSVEKKHKVTMGITMADLDLKPPYAEDLYEMINRFLENSQYSILLPRFIDFYHYSLINKTNIERIEVQYELQLNQDQFEYVLKFTRDVVQFIFGKNVPDIFDQLMKLN